MSSSWRGSIEWSAIASGQYQDTHKIKEFGLIT